MDVKCVRAKRMWEMTVTETAKNHRRNHQGRANGPVALTKSLKIDCDRFRKSFDLTDFHAQSGTYK